MNLFKNYEDNNAIIYRSWDEVPDMMTPREVSALLRISKTKVYEKIKTGELPCKTIFNKLYIKKEDVKNYINWVRVKEKSNVELEVLKYERRKENINAA